MTDDQWLISNCSGTHIPAHLCHTYHRLWLCGLSVLATILNILQTGNFAPLRKYPINMRVSRVLELQKAAAQGLPYRWSKVSQR